MKMDSTQSLPNARSSNVELLRLLLMFFILMHHYLLNGLKNAGFHDDSMANPLATFIDPFFFVGVNCFVMISGFWGIKLKSTGLYKLFVQCALVPAGAKRGSASTAMVEWR